MRWPRFLTRRPPRVFVPVDDGEACAAYHAAVARWPAVEAIRNEHQKIIRENHLSERMARAFGEHR